MIASAYKTMKEYANHVTEESQALTKKVNALNAAQTRNKQFDSSKELLSQATGLIRAAMIVADQLSALPSAAQADSTMTQEILVILHTRITKEVKARHEAVQNTIRAYKE